MSSTPTGTTRRRVAEVLEATIGGTRRHFTALVTRLPSEGFDVRAVCAVGRDPAFRDDIPRMQAAGATVTELHMVRPISPAADLRAYRALRELLSRDRCDLVHTHSSKAGFVGRLAARASGVPVAVHSAHTFAFEMQAPAWKRAMYRALERHAARRTDLLIAVSEAERRVAIEAGLFTEGKIEVIPNGIDLREFDRRAGVGGEAIPGLAPDDLVVGTVGRLAPQKGLRFLLDAAPAVLRAHPSALFVLIGDGELRPALARQAERLGIANRVRLLGHREGVERLYPLMRVFALPSLWEACPYALLEAMAARVPIVASALPACAEILDGGSCGLLVPPGNSDAVATAICGLLAPGGSGAAMGETGRRRVEQAYTIERQIAQVAAAYRRLLARTS